MNVDSELTKEGKGKSVGGARPSQGEFLSVNLNYLSYFYCL